MKRKGFIQKAILGAAGLASAPYFAMSKSSTYDEMMPQVGFNHLPIEESKSDNMVIHRADSRGGADHGWLKTKHSFSFAKYYNPERMNFGSLRVLNDDRIDGGTGFRMHPHDNMEIVSIPLGGALEHKDSMGNISVIKEHEVQVMSAGKGIFHSEYNKNKEEEAQFLQIWIFPSSKNVTPRYGQKAYMPDDRVNKIQTVVSPDKNNPVWINQNAHLSLVKLDKGKDLRYQVKDPMRNGVYAFQIEGSSNMLNETIGKRDAMGIWNVDKLDFTAKEDSDILLIEVPMMI